MEYVPQTHTHKSQEKYDTSTGDGHTRRIRIRLANIIWMSLVRSIVEYGCEIWGEKGSTEVEKLQLDMGKKILRCGSRTNEEVVRGELGWERQKARYDELRLRYWGKIVRMPGDRLVKIVYKESQLPFFEEKEVEDESHFMLRCNAYTVQRAKMWEEYERITQSRRESLESEDAQMAALLGDTHQPEEEEDKESVRSKTYKNIVKTVMIFITSAMKERRRRDESEV